jgi:pyruvate carboxylase
VLDASATGTREARRRLDPTDPRQVGTTVPGVITVLVEPGEAVEAGDRLAVIEAMKMESVVTAPRAGTVAAVHCATGDQVDAGDLVAEIS